MGCELMRTPTYRLAQLPVARNDGLQRFGAREDLQPVVHGLGRDRDRVGARWQPRAHGFHGRALHVGQRLELRGHEPVAASEQEQQRRQQKSARASCPLPHGRVPRGRVRKDGGRDFHTRE
jgi:hypothetical protein